MNDTPVDMTALANVVDPVPTVSDSISRLVKAHDMMHGALGRVAGLTDNLAGPILRTSSAVVADARQGLAVTLANIVAQYEETAGFIVEEVTAIERAIG